MKARLQTMMEWLESSGLTRKALQLLQENAALHTAYKVRMFASGKR